MKSKNMLIIEWYEKVQLLLNRLNFITEKYNLSVSSFILLNRIYCNGKLTPHELSKADHISNPAVSRKLNILQRKKYIKKNRNDPNDQRVVNITLTELGKEVYLTILNELNDINVVSEKNIDSLNEIVSKIDKI